MTHFLVEYNNKIIGTYDDYELAETFILGCLQNNLMQNQAKILKFKPNSCYMYEHNIVTLKSMQPVKQQIVQQEIKDIPVFVPASKPVQPVPTIDYNKPEIVEIAKQKLELQHNINLLKVHKQRIEESKKVYENDLKLYDVFTDNLMKDKTFVIPPLFVDKYNIIKDLKENNKLSWENFTALHKKENYYGDYFGINDYEDFFIKPKESDNMSEELEIDSNTETSEN